MMQILIRSGERPDDERRWCFDCANMQAARGWWCVSEQAVRARHTQLPGCADCPQWKPARYWADLSRWERFKVWLGVGNYITV